MKDPRSVLSLAFLTLKRSPSDSNRSCTSMPSITKLDLESKEKRGSLLFQTKVTNANYASIQE